MSRKIGIAVATTIVIVALIVCFVPFMGYLEKTPLSYEVINTHFEPGHSESSYVWDSPFGEPHLVIGRTPAEADVVIQNTDNEAGLFSVQFTFYNGWINRTYFYEENAMIKLGENATIRCESPLTSLDDDHWWDYEVVPGTKTTYRRVSLLDYLLHH